MARYTGVYNVLDYSAVSFVTGIAADSAVDVAGHREPFGDVDAKVQANCTFPEMTSSRVVADQGGPDDPEAVHGLPVSLQLVGRRLEEEKVLAIAGRVCKDLA